MIGANAERELLKLFWKNDIACVRIAGSGVSKFPCPDLLAGNKIKILAIEVKYTKKSRKYIRKEQMNELISFSNIFGAFPIIAIKFDIKKSREKWFFFEPDDMIKTKQKNFMIDVVKAQIIGTKFEELFN